MGHRGAHSRDQALQQARREHGVDGTVARRQVSLRRRRRKGRQGRHREAESPSRSRSTRKWSWITRPRRRTSSTTAGVNSKQKLVFPDLQNVDWDSYYATYRRFLPSHQQQLRLRRDAERDARRDERLSHRLLTTAPNVPNSDATASLGAALRLRLHRRRRESGRGARGRPGRSGGLDDQDRPHHRSHRWQQDRRRDGLLQAAQSKGRQVHAAGGLRSRCRTSVGTKPSSR